MANATQNRNYGTKPVPIVEFHREHRSDETVVVPVLHIDRISKIIQDSGVENIPVVIISVAGAARTGKSFLLSLMVDYHIHKVEKKGSDWLKSGNRITGFEWAQSDDAQTYGMWMWERAIITELEDGTKVAYLYVDTQGTGDRIQSADPNIDTLIMFISLEISAIQIHNLNQQWTITDLKAYEVCKMFDKMVDRSKRDFKPFNRLVLVYRNWQNDNRYGYRDNYIEREMLEKKANPNSEAYCATLSGINESFNSVFCAMLHHPGTAITQASREIFLNQIDEMFLKDVVSLFDHILRNMTVCKKGADVVNLMQELKDRVESNDLPTIKSPLQHLAETQNAKAFQQACDLFKEELDQRISLVKTVDDLNSFGKELNDINRKTEEKFISNAFKDDGSAIYEFYEQKLKAQIKDVAQWRLTICQVNMLAQEEFQKNRESLRYKELLKEKEDLENKEKAAATKRGWNWRKIGAGVLAMGSIAGAIMTIASMPSVAPLVGGVAVGKTVYDLIRPTED